MALHRSGRAAGGLVTVAVVAAGLAASLGAGYTVAQASLHDSSAYVGKGSQVAHVNGESRSVDATSKGAPLAKDGQRVITQVLPDGRLVAVNQTTGTVTTIDPGTMSPTSTDRGSGAVNKAPAVVRSGDVGWLVAFDDRTVQELVNGKDGHPIKIDGRPVDAAPGPSGSLLVLTREGALYRVGTDRKVTRIDVETATGAALTVAAGHAYLVTTGGGVIDVSGDGARKVGTVAGARPGGDGRMLVGSIEGAGEHVLVVFQDSLAVFDPATGRAGATVPLGTNGNSLGEPVEYRGKVYVPDYDAHRLVVVDIAGKTAGKPIGVPGKQHYFDLFVTGGRLWANDQYAQHLVELGPDGKHEVDKGPGDGVKDDKDRPPPSTNLPVGTGTLPTGGGTGTTGSTGGGGTGNNGSNGNNGGTGTGGNGGGSGSGNGGNGSGAGGGGKPPVEYRTIPEFSPSTTYDVACQRLEELELRCNAVSREEKGAEPDVVLQVEPRSGRKVPVDSSVTVIYVGPSKVPDIPAGTLPVDACQQFIEAAGFTCEYDPATAPAPADNLSAFGTVAGTVPGGGEELDNGKPVSIQYYDSFVMPNYADQSGTNACATLSQLSVTVPDASGTPQTTQVQCSAPPGNPAPKDGSKPAGTVYEQNPVAGTEVKSGAGVQLTVTLTTWNGQANLPDYRITSDTPESKSDFDTQIVPSCNQYFNCSTAPDTRVPIDGNGQPQPGWAGKVAAMRDGGGGEIGPGPRNVNESISLVRFAQSGHVDDWNGKSPADACNAIRAAGLICNDTQHPIGRHAGVVGQNPGPGDYPIGTTINVPNVTVEPTLFALYANDYDKAILKVAPAGQAPPGYGQFVTNSFIAYLPNQLPPETGAANWRATEFGCSCGGHNGNLVYSHGNPNGTGDDKWGATGYTAAEFIPPGPNNSCDTANGQTYVYRTSDFHGGGVGNHTYSLQSSPTPIAPGQNDYPEFLGCGWA